MLRVSVIYKVNYVASGKQRVNFITLFAFPLTIYTYTKT